MIVLVAFTFGLVVWIVLWAIGLKGFDAFLFTGFITLVAAGIRLAQPHVERLLKGPPTSPGQ